MYDSGDALPDKLPPGTRTSPEAAELVLLHIASCILWNHGVVLVCSSGIVYTSFLFSGLVSIQEQLVTVWACVSFQYLITLLFPKFATR